MDRLALLRIIARHPGQDARQLAEEAGLPLDATKAALKALRGLGLARTVPGPDGTRVYVLDEAQPPGPR